jgi:hypothetical protein
VNLVSPAETTALVGIPKTHLSPEVIEVNGQVVWSKGEFKGGVPGVSWKGDSGDFIQFEVAPGTWTFVAKEVP